MRKLSKSKEYKIIKHLFSGRTYREISNIENVSTGTISGVFKEFVGMAEDFSISDAAEEYNAEEEIDLLLEYARERRRLRVPQSDLLTAVRLIRFMRARGLDGSQLEDYLKMCDKHRKDLPNFAAKATEFYRIEEKTGKPYEKIVEEYPILVEKRTEIRKEVKELKEKRNQNRKDLDQELRRNNLLRKEIPYASGLKESLRKYNYAVEDTSKIPKFLREIEACGKDAEVFLQRAEEVKDLKWELLNLRDEKQRVEPIVETMKKVGFELQTKRDNLQDEITRLKITKEALLKENERLEKQATLRSNDLLLADCLSGILRSKPSDVDVLYKHAYWLKQIASEAAPHLVQRRPQYEKAVRTLIVNTFVEYLKEDLATRDEVTKLESRVKEQDKYVETVNGKIAWLEKANTDLTAENTKLKEEVSSLKVELEECNQRLLMDPTIKPKDQTFPLR